jgi:uncharacterized protein (AIM24 family)
MSASPVLMSSGTKDGTFAGVTYRMGGELAPALTVTMTPAHSVYFKHRSMLLKETGVEIFARMPGGFRGAWRRYWAGLDIIVTEARGEGLITFRHDAPGTVLAMHLKHGQDLHVREHQFLAATHLVEYQFKRIKGPKNMAFGGSGLFMDRFYCQEGEGVLWLQGHGNVFEVQLAAGEEIDVLPHNWLYKDTSIGMQTIVQKPTGSFLAGSSLMVNRFKGPGRVGIQTMHREVADGASVVGRFIDKIIEFIPL